MVLKKFNKDISTHVGRLDCSYNKLTNLDIDNLICDWTMEEKVNEYKRLNLYEFINIKDNKNVSTKYVK